jgi:uncharacterized protein YndB with AHSA1/START domain
MSQDFVVDREVIIRARRSTVFRYFTDTERFAAWWGAGSSIEARPGGKVHIRYPEGTTAGGEVVAIRPNESIVFTYGYDDVAKPIPRGGSRVEVTFEDWDNGTRVKLVHHVDTAAIRDDHEPGWRFQLSLFANVASREIARELTAIVDRYFEVWSEPDASKRATTMGSIATPNVTFRDDFAAIASRADLLAHVAASQLHMPGARLEREGSPAFCQGTALVEWIARGKDGTPIGKGTNVFELDPDGKIASAIGFWKR